MSNGRWNRVHNSFGGAPPPSTTKMRNNPSWVGQKHLQGRKQGLSIPTSHVVIPSCRCQSPNSSWQVQNFAKTNCNSTHLRCHANIYEITECWASQWKEQVGMGKLRREEKKIDKPPEKKGRAVGLNCCWVEKTKDWNCCLTGN